MVSAGRFAQILLPIRGSRPQVRSPDDPFVLDNLGQYDCVLIVTDHTDYDYRKIVNEAQLVVDSRYATRGIKSDKLCTARTVSAKKSCA